MSPFPYLSLPKELSDEELQQVLRILVTRLLENRPDLKVTEETKENIVQQMALGLKDARGEVLRDEITNPEFLHKITLALAIAVSVDKEDNKPLLKKLATLFGKKDLKNDDLKKLLSPAELKKIADLQNEILKDLAAFKLINSPPKLEMKPGNKKKEENKDDLSETLTETLGVLSPFLTGGIAAVVQVFMGNVNGLIDWNPFKESSTAQISLQDKLHSDLLGVNVTAEKNYFQAGFYGDDFMRMLQQDKILPQPPHPTPLGGGGNAH